MVVGKNMPASALTAALLSEREARASSWTCAIARLALHMAIARANAQVLQLNLPIQRTIARIGRVRLVPNIGLRVQPTASPAGKRAWFEKRTFEIAIGTPGYHQRAISSLNGRAMWMPSAV
jgi:hypothetical protein